MKILGLNTGEINSSAALVIDGKVAAGAPEERFTRQKLTKDFPHNSINYCLESQEFSLTDCDAIAQGWNPGANWQRFNSLISKHRAQRENYFYSLADNLFSHLPNRAPGDWTLMEMPKNSNCPPLYFVQHHRAHAANSFFLSPFEEAAILTCDFRGEVECTTFSHGKNTEIKTLSTQTMPHSLGLFYATFTELLGYKYDSDEWKVMALSAFDVDYKEIFEKLRSTYRLLEDGSLELDQSYYKGAIFDQPNLYTEKLLKLLGGHLGASGEEATTWHFSIAKAMQAAAEEIAVHFLNHLYKLTKCDNIVLGGGFFMNSVLNGQIIDLTPFKNVFVPYAPTDSGNSIGAALYVSHCIKNTPRSIQYNSSEIGPLFSNNQILTSLRRREISFTTCINIEQSIAQILAEGEILAVANGPMEFGDRALGNRSILADPRPASMKEQINTAIKYRENYRPFAPVVPEEEVGTYFDVADDFTCPYMEKVVPIRKQWHERLGAVTHVDGSGRVQTVNQKHNPKFHKILNEFKKLTGIPIVLNTSLNINGEPMALSPDDALNTFFNSGLKFLALGNHIIHKQEYKFKS